ncbi:MAG: flagellin [Gemmatimonadetes bacterium]|nr:flagellin [Gemmatimonadota bacterium]|tara:strand:+ start:1228 stop:2421 length:1194 start_codon:yes stop_codon:yes gene_type:complete
MPLRVNNNIIALNTRRQLLINNRQLATRIERLSSGLRINRAADDAAGLSVSEGMRAELGGWRQAIRNAEQGTNLIQTAEGALNEVSAILIRMRELAVQSASSTLNDGNRTALNSEVVHLITEMDRIANVTTYNGISLLNGFGNTISEDLTASTAMASTTTGILDVSISGAEAGNYVFIDNVNTDNQITLGNGVATQTIDIGPALDLDGAGGVVATGSAIVANFDRIGIQLTLSGERAATLTSPALDGYRDGELDGLTLTIEGAPGGSFQIGPEGGAVHRLSVNITDMRASGVNLNLSDVSIATMESSRGCISTIDLAIDRVAGVRGDLGAIQNRLGFTIRSLENAFENLQASESSIRDADVAEEVSAFTRAQILTQTSTALLAQANAIPQNALSLLQ